jgi:hypothetical protein
VRDGITATVDRIENGLAVLELIDAEGQPVFVLLRAGKLKEGQRIRLVVEVQDE